LAELFPFDDFAVSLQEHCKDAKRLFLNLDANPLAAQGRAGQVYFEQTKSNDYA
jgi:hypothetical protein